MYLLSAAVKTVVSVFMGCFWNDCISGCSWPFLAAPAIPLNTWRWNTGEHKFQAYGRDLSAVANSCKLSSQCDVFIRDAPCLVLSTFKLTDPELQRGKGVGQLVQIFTKAIPACLSRNLNQTWSMTKQKKKKINLWTRLSLKPNPTSLNTKCVYFRQWIPLL